MAAAPCKECKRRPKLRGRHRCATCQLRIEPIDVQVEASLRRLAMVPEELRRKRSKTILALAPVGTTWCAGCQSFRDLVDFGKGMTQCRPCASAKAHAAMIAKTYGLDARGYKALLAAQGGRCAICRARPRSKRLAVDHDHKSGAVLGLLCSRCNKEFKGSAWDSMAMVVALWHYMNTPPALGAWLPPEEAPTIGVLESATRPVDAADPVAGLVTRAGNGSARGADVAPIVAECTKTHVLPVGSESVPGKRGVYRVYVAGDGDTPF